MDILDAHNMQGMHLMMDNVRIHHSVSVLEAIKTRGYKPLFLPPQSPFLNPIEECWAKLKTSVRREPLFSKDTSNPVGSKNNYSSGLSGLDQARRIILEALP